MSRVVENERTRFVPSDGRCGSDVPLGGADDDRHGHTAAGCLSAGRPDLLHAAPLAWELHSLPPGLYEFRLGIDLAILA